MATQVGGQLFGVHVQILKQHQILKISYFHKFTNPFRKTIYLQIYLKITKKFTKRFKTYICGMSLEILDCLKRKREICIKTIIPNQNTAFMWTPKNQTKLN